MQILLWQKEEQIALPGGVVAYFWYACKWQPAFNKSDESVRPQTVSQALHMQKNRQPIVTESELCKADDVSPPIRRRYHSVSV